LQRMRLHGRRLRIGAPVATMLRNRWPNAGFARSISRTPRLAVAPPFGELDHCLRYGDTARVGGTLAVPNEGQSNVKSEAGETDREFRFEEVGNGHK
jgi:hypothetical protein